VFALLKHLNTSENYLKLKKTKNVSRRLREQDYDFEVTMASLRPA
jgi:hypothetical protein